MNSNKTYNKILFRSIKKNLLHMIIIFLLCFISIAIVSSIGVLAPKLWLGIEALEANTPGLYLAYPRNLASGIDTISFIFPLFFTSVTILVASVSLTRLIDIERSENGCLVSLGKSKFSIVGKYILIVAISSILGVIFGLIIGFFAITPLLFSIISEEFRLPDISAPFPYFGLIVSIIVVVFLLTLTVLLVYRSLLGKPATLLRSKPPIKGGKIMLENLGIVWRILPFRYKSTLRNILRYRLRFFLTVFSVLFSSALVFCAVALSFVLALSNPDLTTFIRPISAVLAIAAVMLNVLVIYNLTNINIEERSREIATLKVLGYRNIEVTGYCFREIFILSVFGILIGLPMGYGFMVLIFDRLTFGGIEFLNWYNWIITATIALASLGLTLALLYKKLHKVDLTSSLKAID